MNDDNDNKFFKYKKKTIEQGIFLFSQNILA